MLSQLEAADYQIVHAIPGRVRIKIPALGRDAQYADRLEQSIKVLPGVRDVRTNAASASITVTYSNGAGNTEKLQQDVQHQIIHLIQQASNGAVPVPTPPASSGAIAAPVASPLPVISTANPTHPDDPALPEASHTSNLILPTTSLTAAQIRINVPRFLDALEISLPQKYAYDFDYFPLEIHQKSKLLRLGIPAKLLLEILNTEVEKFTTESERSTDTEKIHLDVNLSLIEAGLFLKGNAKGKFRKELFTGPITKRKRYTPWVGMSAVGEADLALSIIDEVLHISMKDLRVSGEPGEWKEHLISYAFDFLIKDRLMKRINKVLSNYSGEKLQTLFFQTKDGQDFLNRIEPIGLTHKHINALLELFEVHVNLTVDYLWLSIQF